MGKEKNILAEDVIKKYEVISHFEKIELGEIIDDFENGFEESYKDKFEISTPRVKEIFENYVKMTADERSVFIGMIEIVEN